MKISKCELDLCRARKGLKLSELGVSKSVIARINADLDIKPYTVGKIAAALDCDVADILMNGGDCN